MQPNKEHIPHGVTATSSLREDSPFPEIQDGGKRDSTGNKPRGPRYKEIGQINRPIPNKAAKHTRCITERSPWFGSSKAHVLEAWFQVH